MGRGSRFPGAALYTLLTAIALVVGAGYAQTKLTVQQACFNNLQRLAQATLMYVADNDDRFPPNQTPVEPYTCQWGADNSSPWLRWPVVLDPYLRDRSPYLCKGVEALPLGHSVATRPGWITDRPITTKSWPNGPCGGVFPPGWGGGVTDSAVQSGVLDPGRFLATVGAATAALSAKQLSSVGDPKHTIVWADSSRMSLNLGSLIWANVCRADCANLKDKADWDNCSWSRKCGADEPFTRSAPLRARSTRHNGGSNIAFVDGHVEWVSAPRIIEDYRSHKLLGVEPANATGGKPWYLNR